MRSTLEVRSTGLKRRCTVVDQASLPERPGERFPTSVLEALRDLVPCDGVTD